MLEKAQVILYTKGPLCHNLFLIRLAVMSQRGPQSAGRSLPAGGWMVQKGK